MSIPGIACRRSSSLEPKSLGDYADIVDRLISIFADVADVDEAALYNDLLVSDRDVIRARADNSDTDGSIDISDGANLIIGARDMLLPQPALWKTLELFTA